jgi:hypothetical protein
MCSNNSNSPDKNLSAICGLFCPSCTFYIASMEDPDRLKTLSERFGRTVEEMECHGCRSDKLGIFCKIYCKMRKCATDKGIDFCSQCNEYPCSELKSFQSQMPHRNELWESLDNIKNNGFEKWYSQMVEHYSCAECNTINSAYDLSCRKCGAEPGNEYVRIHKDEVMKVIKKLGV